MFLSQKAIINLEPANMVGKDNEPCDVALFSIIETEWPEIKASLQVKLQNSRSSSSENNDSRQQT
ncbi:MAG TPA: hypothetical protein VGQ39_07360 [Pyrinomonadaceae bacterium]|jgi:hypothetical protein|nr:hypothetical protein [Pyrinomonadaceae bacterium]